MFGCSPLVLKWFTSYLSDRNQITYFKNTLSYMRPVKIGVPQFLAPFFLSYLSMISLLNFRTQNPQRLQMTPPY
jgi:hypothetical protein